MAIIPTQPIISRKAAETQSLVIHVAALRAHRFRCKRLSSAENSGDLSAVGAGAMIAAGIECRGGANDDSEGSV